MWQTWTYKIVLMKDSHVFYNLIELSQKSILHEFRLQKAPLVNRTVEKSRETNAPKEVGAVFIWKEVFFKVAREVTQLLRHQAKCVRFGVSGDVLSEVALEETQVVIVLLQ